jgi:hypothetical protein
MSQCKSKQKVVSVNGRTFTKQRNCGRYSCSKHGKKNRAKFARSFAEHMYQLSGWYQRDGIELWFVTINAGEHELSKFKRIVREWSKQELLDFHMVTTDMPHVHAHIIGSRCEVPPKPAWCNIPRQFHVRVVSNSLDDDKKLSWYMARHLKNDNAKHSKYLPKPQENNMPIEVSQEAPTSMLSYGTVNLTKPALKNTSFPSGICSRCRARPAKENYRQCSECLDYDKNRQYDFERRLSKAANTYGVSKNALRSLYKAQRANCYWCKDELPQDWQIEHVEARCHNGRNEIDNIVISCRRCNELKNTMTVTQWLSCLASRGIRHELMSSDMPMQEPLFDDKQEVSS